MTKFFARLIAAFKPEKPKKPVTVPAPRKKFKVTQALLGRVRALVANEPEEDNRLQAYKPAPGVMPQGIEPKAAFDDASTTFFAAPWAFGLSLQNGFMGYPYLAQLAQLPEYRKITDTIAKEMTRKWIKINAAGDEEKGDRVAQLEQALVKHRVRDIFREMAAHDGFFGRGQVYIDVRKPGGALASEDDLELKTPLIISPAKIKKGSLAGFRVVEPMWTYPGLYNSTNPLAPDFYKPSTWYVMGKTVHTSRFIMMISRPVPDVLKAAYSFGGLSLSQLAKPYVDHWLRTRNAVSDVVHSFSVNGLATDMGVLTNAQLESEGDLITRAQLFNMMRDNRNLMLIDKDSEEYFQFNIPLSGLDALQAQSQEQMASVSSIPLVKLLGITPNGLNATSDGEIRVFYDDIHAHQENTFREPMKRVLEILQLDLFGEIDPDISFEFVPLFQLSDVEKSNKQKTDADRDIALVDASIVSEEEVRDRMARDQEGPYFGLEHRDQEEIDNDKESAGGESPGEEGEEAARADTTGAGAARDQAQRGRARMVSGKA